MSFDNAKWTENKLLAAKRKLLEDDPLVPHKKSNLSISNEDDYKNSKYQDKKKRKKDKKSKKKKKLKKKHKKRSSSESSSSSNESDWVEKPNNKDVNGDTYEKINKQENQREDWMSMMGSISTFSRKDIKPDVIVEKKGQIDAYNPSQCSRELNPYWKNGGTGLPSTTSQEDSINTTSGTSKESYPDRPSKHREDNNKRDERYSSHKDPNDRNSSKSFRRPEDDYKKRNWQYSHLENDRHRTSSLSFKKPFHDDVSRISRSDRTNSEYESELVCKSLKQNWKKSQKSNESKTIPEQIDQSNYTIKEQSNDDIKKISQNQDEGISPPHTSQKLTDPKISNQNKFLSDVEMNALGAKIVKAEILGNTKLVNELTAKLEAARKYKKENPHVTASTEEAVMLTVTDGRGNTRPLTKTHNAGDRRSKGGKKKSETHNADGERMKFFADDDKYSLKEMFQKEKFENANDSEEQFAKIISKHRNPNDDLEDIFAENITKNKSDAKSDEQNLNKAISQHKSIKKSLTNCEYCIQSDKMIKHMIVSLGTAAYVSLPPKTSLTEGHCLISTVGHVQCSTMADEDVWSEIMNYRKAITRMFNSRDEDVVFFETASFFHTHPHMVIQCVPIPRDVGDTAPIYFKKALLECEAEWSTNKKVVDLKGKDIRRGVPKELPYFWVDFGMDPGFAHIIEDQQLFPSNFAQEIIGGMLDLHHSLWRKPQRENFEVQMKKTNEFTKIWKTYDPLTSTN